MNDEIAELTAQVAELTARLRYTEEERDALMEVAELPPGVYGRRQEAEHDED